MKNRVMLFLLFSIILLNCSKDNSVEEEPIVYVNSVQILGSDITEGVNSQMEAIVLPENANNKSILWESSDVSVAEISSSGLITAKKNGTVTITATARDRGTIKSTKTITITSFDTGGGNVTVGNVTELLQALANAAPGSIIVVNEGDYILNTKITINISGTSGENITLMANESQGRPKLDFSSMAENSSNRGVSLSASYWHIKGIDVFGAGDNGMFISGNNNLIEFCTFSENSDSGLQIGNGGSNNTILNCDSYFNADSSIENADGFACKLDAGTGNKFIGCRAWQNLDDGWDGYLRGNDNITTTYENCWAINNGYLEDGTVSGGDGNGFKTGGSDNKDLKHNSIYTNCIAVGNGFDGFDHNSNRGDVTIYNCSAYDNGKNYSFSTTNPLNQLIIKNSNTFGSFGTTNADNTDITNNSWQDGIIADENDFESIDYSQLLAPRKVDGSLPDVTFFHLKAGSDLIDSGVDVGLPFNGSAPDLGAFEY
ncbi:MAG TPA: Ig-like domain-containing protein [Flavobacteriaceae bacterium]|nr:Ig-like domain-containing protein [Flavobacteriaceae bacterium]